MTICSHFQFIEQGSGCRRLVQDAVPAGYDMDDTGCRTDSSTVCPTRE